MASVPLAEPLPGPLESPTSRMSTQSTRLTPAAASLCGYAPVRTIILPIQPSNPPEQAVTHCCKSKLHGRCSELSQPFLIPLPLLSSFLNVHSSTQSVLHSFTSYSSSCSNLILFQPDQSFAPRRFLALIVYALASPSSSQAAPNLLVSLSLLAYPIPSRDARL